MDPVLLVGDLRKAYQVGEVQVDGAALRDGRIVGEHGNEYQRAPEELHG